MKLSLAPALSVLATPALAHPAALPHSHEPGGLAVGVAVIAVALTIAAVLRLRA